MKANPEFCAIKITFPSGETGKGVVRAEDGKVLVEAPFVPSLVEQEMNEDWWEQLERCCHVFVNGELAHAVTSIDLVNGIHIERVVLSYGLDQFVEKVK